MYFFVPETKGLNDAEKKSQFYPGAKWGRKLKPNEPIFVPEDQDSPKTVRDVDGIGDTLLTTPTQSMDQLYKPLATN